MSHREHPQSDADRIALDNLPPSLRPRRWERQPGDTAPQLVSVSDPDPDLDDQIEAAGEQPAP